MNRRTFTKLAGLAVAGLSGTVQAEEIARGVSSASAPGTEIILEDQDLLIAFDRASGALTRMVCKESGWAVERRPELGVSFRMLVPLHDRRENYILGAKQKNAEVQRVGTSQVRIRWQNLVSEHGGELPIVFTALITLRNGVLTFAGSVENGSQLAIETLDYPCLGDLNPPSRDSVLEAQHMWTGALVADPLYPRFDNAKGYWGVRYPTRTVSSDQCQFCLLQAPEQGVYTAVHDPQIRYLVEFTFEQRPGTVDWVNNQVPREDTISGMPVQLEFRTCHFLFVHPQTTVELAPVVMQPYKGDWHSGLDVYRQWRATWFGRPHTPAWACDVHSWLQLQVNGAEQDYSIPYRELLRYGEECADNGVAAIQLVGWNHGGQDGGDPSLDTDPMLGTWQELHDAIAAIQSRGVHMILFGKPVFADMSTEYYKTELYKYECIDPYGNKYESNGYAYSTPTQLAGLNQRRRAIMDVCDPGYQAVALREFEKTVALGAHGWLFDEVMQHNGVIYNFGPGHGYQAPGYLYGADIPLVKKFRAAADSTNPDFLFAGEGPGDWLMPFYTLGYYRIGAGMRHALRYIDPHAPLMAAVRGLNARDEINLCLLYRYIISYEPFNFKGHVTDFPLTLAYGRSVDAFRRQHRRFLWDGEFRDTVGVPATADGRFQYAVYVAADGKRGVALVNLEQSRPITVTLKLEHAAQAVTATPEQPEPVSAAHSVVVAARSAALWMEV